MAEVEQTDVSKIDWLLVQSLLWNHVEGDTGSRIRAESTGKDRSAHWSHSFQRSSHCAHLGTFLGITMLAFSFSVVIGDSAGPLKLTNGRSNSQSRYSESGAFQELTNLRSASLKSCNASSYEYYKVSTIVYNSTKSTEDQTHLVAPLDVEQLVLLQSDIGVVAWKVKRLLRL
jgi:hypothetical protein